MAQYTDVILPAETWTQLTNADATSARVSNMGGFPIILKGSTGATAPTTITGAVPLDVGMTVAKGDFTLDELFPAGTNRVWAYCRQPCVVSVCHDDA